MAKKQADISKAEVKSNLDVLFSNVENFRESENFRQMMDFVSSFRHLSPYNAFLLHQQRPGTKYVLNAATWHKRYNRKIKPDARPLIILVPFGPVDYVYDISDTYEGSDIHYPSLFSRTDDDILSAIVEPFKTSGHNPQKEMAKLVESMNCNGIALDNNLKVGNDFAGKIQLLNEDYHPTIEVKFNNKYLRFYANYLLSIRDKADTGEAFATAVHELGHLFCHHLPAAPAKAWEIRDLDNISKEFEAEAVSFIVCNRFGVKSPSADYLSLYYTKNKTIPNISVETIFTACNMILNMISGINVKKGILYNHDDAFKKKIDSITKN